MQRKPNISSQTSVTDMHFAVVPYEVQYLVPKEQIYQIYFQKGLQILGTTQYPIENHQKIKTIELPILNNIILFRLFSDKNAEYQWSIYKRVNDMQQFLESKKINLKDILKKQPQRRLEKQKKNQTERKQSINSRRNETKSSDTKGTGTKSSQFKPLESKSNQIKAFDQNAADKLSQVSVEGKGLIYDQQVKSDLGQFVLKFYVFRAFSKQELIKTIEQKSRQKKQIRTPLSQISVNKISELPKVSKIQPNVQQEAKKEVITSPQPEQIKHQNVEILPTLLQVQKTDQIVNQVQLEQVIQQPKQVVSKEDDIIENNLQLKIQTPQVNQEQRLQVLEGSSKEIGQTPIRGENQGQQQAVITQVPSLGQQSSIEQTVVVQSKAPFVFSMGKKMFLVGLVLTILLYVLYSMNVFDKLSLAEKVTEPKVGKKQKKEKFSNRKKTSK